MADGAVSGTPCMPSAPGVHGPRPARRRPGAPWPVLCALCWACVTLGCRRETVQVYEVEKAAHTAADESPADTGQARGPQASPVLKYSLPAGWSEMAPSAMRAASFRIAGADAQSAEVAVVPLQGMAGRELELLNMWRAQVGLEAIAAGAAADRLGTPVRIGQAEGRLFDLVGPGQPTGGSPPRRILAAVLEQGGTSWVFKLSGPEPLVAAQQAAFLDFLHSVEFLDARPGPSTPGPKRRRQQGRLQRNSPDPVSVHGELQPTNTRDETRPGCRAVAGRGAGRTTEGLRPRSHRVGRADGLT